MGKKTQTWKVHEGCSKGPCLLVILGDHFRWFKGLAKVLQKKTPQDYTFSQQMRDSIIEYMKMQESHPQKGIFWTLVYKGLNLQLGLSNVGIQLDTPS